MPAQISAEFIAKLRGCCCHSDRDGWRLAPGTVVRVLRGPFVSTEAIVTWSDGERVRLLISLLGREDIRVTMAVSDVFAVGDQHPHLSGGYHHGT